MFGHDDNKDDNQPDDTNLPMVTDDSTSPAPVADGTLDSPAADLPDSSSVPSPSPSFPDIPTRPTTDSPSGVSDMDDLISVKQQVLQDLHPLVNHLDQTPEEKFKTLMMMIQASDDKNLVHSAYEAAKEITDEKTRAQALLDVVNEINYFTQPKN